MPYLIFFRQNDHQHTTLGLTIKMKAIAYTFLLVIAVFSLHLAVDYLIDSHLEGPADGFDLDDGENLLKSYLICSIS